jgi:hypothetical protein
MRLWLLFVGLLLGCGGASSSIGGVWNSPGEVSGSGISMTLIDDLGSISGTGVQRVEAGMPRTFNVVGSLNGHSVTLGIWYQDQKTVSFQGKFDEDTLKGTWIPRGEAGATLTFTR